MRAIQGFHFNVFAADNIDLVLQDGIFLNYLHIQTI